MANQNKILTSPEKCSYCDSNKLITGPGSGPHYASLICAACGRHIRWLPKPRAPQNHGTDAARARPIQAERH